MDKSPNRQPHAVEEAVEQLSGIASRLDQCSSSQREPLLRDYIELYVRNRSHSEELLSCFCEHMILQRLFVHLPKHSKTLQVLELFHFLLSNTHQNTDLVFLFSQPALHHYLFEKVQIHKEHSEAVQYYVQLLKIIILKLGTPGNESMLKLFCNARFPDFPLLATPADIATCARNIDSMVVITAQQCVLLLLTLMVRLKTGLCYLSDLQMAVFYFEVGKAVAMEVKKGEQEQWLKYLVDLVIVLQGHPMSLTVLMNSLTNNLLTVLREWPQIILRTLRQLENLMHDIAELPKEVSAQIMQVLYRVVSKVYGPEGVDYSYYWALTLLPTIRTHQAPILNKFYQQRCQRISQHLLTDQPVTNWHQELLIIYEQWTHLNQDLPSPTAPPLHHQNSFTEFFKGKSQAIQRYLASAMAFCGLEIQKMKNPLAKLSWSCDFRTAIFLVETANLSHPPALTLFSRPKGWVLSTNSDLLQELSRLSEEVEKQSHQTEGSQGKKMLVRNVRKILPKLMMQDLTNSQKFYSLGDLGMISRTVSKMKLNSQIGIRQTRRMLEIMRELQRKIAEDTLEEQLYPYLQRYITTNKEAKILKDTHAVEQKKNSNKGKLQLYFHLFLYSLLKRWLDPSIKSISDFLVDFWHMKLTEPVAKHTSRFRVLMRYEDCQQQTIEVMATDSLDFEMKITQKEGASYYIRIHEQDCFQKEEKVCFKNYPQGITMPTPQKSKCFMRDIDSLKQTKKQLVRMAVLEYLQFTYQSLENRHEMREKRSSARIFDTPTPLQ